MTTNAVYILTAEAKDLYNSNNLCYENPSGYGIRQKEGNINTRKFINTLDYSLDLIKLREIYEKIYRRHDFSFKSGNKEYTRHVINVKFTYAQKVFNKAGGGVYVRNGYQYRDIELKDHICVKDNILIAIEVDKDVENPYSNLSVLDKYFVYEDGQYKSTSQNNTILTKAELRQYLYKHGFMCDGIKYVRWKRSSGSSRVGKCLFINEALYSRIHKWETCSLKINHGDSIDLAAFEAYIALTASSIIDTLEIKPENFLVISDYASVFKDTVMGVEYENNELVSKVNEYEISNSIFDGESLMDENLVPEKYKAYSMLLLRNRFFKSAAFKCKIQKWFKDNNITDISQLNGFTLAKDISDIKVITTPSSIKYSKFGTIEEWLKLIEPIFGIVKHEKPTHYFDGRKVSCHYQLINTLQLSKKEVETLLRPSLDYIMQVRNDSDILRHHIKYPYEERQQIVPLHNKNEIVFKLLGLNSDFSKTKLYYEFRDSLVKAMIRELKQGHVLINGNYSTLLGNGIEMLQHSIGTFNGESVLGKGNIYSKRFEFGKTLLASRSPHICSGNIVLSQNIHNDLIETYFDLSNEVVYINAIGENIQQRCNGADYDSDSLLLTDDKLLIQSAQKNYDIFKVPTCFVSSKSKIKRCYTEEQQADLDIKTSVNKIGEIVNLSQYLQSIMWDCFYKDKKNNRNLTDKEIILKQQELYGDICILAVMSGIEIDKAKKEFVVDTQKEIQRLKEKYKITEDNTKSKKFNHINKKQTVKPMFFKMITLENGYKISDNHLYRYFNTPMDYLQHHVSKFNFYNNRLPKQELLPFSAIVKSIDNQHISNSYYEQRDRIINIIEDTNKKIKQLYIDYPDSNKEEKEIINIQAYNIKQECIEYISDLTVSEKTIYLLLLALDKKEYKHIQKRMFEILFGVPNKVFFQMIIDNQGEINRLVESEKGEYLLYDLRFAKQAI